MSEPNAPSYCRMPKDGPWQYCARHRSSWPYTDEVCLRARARMFEGEPRERFVRSVAVP